MDSQGEVSLWSSGTQHVQFCEFHYLWEWELLKFHRPCSLKKDNSQSQEIKKIKGTTYFSIQNKRTGSRASPKINKSKYTFRSNFALLTIGSDFWPSILLSTWVFSFLNLCSAPHISELLHITLMLSFTRQAVYLIPKPKHISDLSQSFCAPQLFLW